MAEKEYIERGALKNDLHFTKNGILYYNGKAYMDLDVIDKIVLEIPTADVVEVVHGEWKREQNRRTCSYCEFVYYDNGGLFNYCPNCGAKMDGGNKDG